MNRGWWRICSISPNPITQTIGGTAFLPGTIRAADRFARASFFLKALPRRLDPAYSDGVPGHTFSHQALASVLSLVRGVSVPLGITTPGQPNIASTIWRVISDQRRRVLLFDAVTSPSVFWVSLDQLDLNPGQPVRRLQVAGGRTYAGEAAPKFEPSTPFTFLPASGLKAANPSPAAR
jgi:penicillin V acylase-like amidase (Ntn superfamily)